MEGSWNVDYQDRVIGICTLERQDLYWRINCRCSGVIDGICRLILKCGSDFIDLGILVPVNGGFGLEKRIPVKKIPVGQPQFYIRSVAASEDEFIPVRAGESFGYLSRLDGSRFAYRNGQAGILLKRV